MTILGRLAAFGVAVCISCATAQSAVAQPYPSKPVRIVCAFPVGGIADLYARIIAQHAAESWGQPVRASSCQTTLLFATMPTVLPHAKAGKLRALATIGATRAAATPELPTVGEALPGFEVNNWIGLFAPPVVKASGARVD